MDESWSYARLKEWGGYLAINRFSGPGTITQDRKVRIQILSDTCHATLMRIMAGKILSSF